MFFVKIAVEVLFFRFKTFSPIFNGTKIRKNETDLKLLERKCQNFKLFYHYSNLMDLFM